MEVYYSRLQHDMVCFKQTIIQRLALKRMKYQKRIRDYGFSFGELKEGKLNSITDVNCVKVGHLTIQENDNNTGVIAILPHERNLYKEKVVAASLMDLVKQWVNSNQ